MATLGDLMQAAESRMPQCEVGEVREFFRAGELPECGYSQNYREGISEDGVSVYWYPYATSFAGLTGRPWYRGLGRLIGFGSDGEPIIEPIGRWKKFFDPSKHEEEFGNALNLWFHTTT